MDAERLVVERDPGLTSRLTAAWALGTRATVAGLLAAP
jgi:hypothetical protein